MFYIGGIATLYGTVFAGVAAHSRIFSDMCRLLGFFAAGGVAQAATLPVIAAGVLYLRHRQLPPGLAPSRLSTLWLWFASLVVICLMAYYAVASLR